MIKKQSSSVFLPNHILPSHYDIFLSPDLDNFVFEGEESISIEVKKPESLVLLHCAEIEVLEALVLVGKRLISSKKISYSKKSETVSITFSSVIPKGKAKIKLKFAGILNDKMRGFYRSRYEHEGKTYHMGVTQFESTDARRAFPCFDEPAKKATFDVSLRVPFDRTVISNTLEEEVVEHEGGYKVVKFERSPKMSSYLLAFIIGHFEYVEKTTKEGVKVRVYVTPGKKHQAKFALEVAVKVMSFYHNYFGIAYPLPTMDLIAIPDFANGAMENWGAVTYRESALLFDEDHSSLHTKQWVAIIIAHELAHQWFGNLVTMKWWTHLWLNEGFASFMEYVAVDKLFPEWNIWTQFAFTEQAKALSLDGMTNTHAIEIPVHHPGEISEIFDAVSYSKGASVIKMLQDYIGEENFQKGLQVYLKKHQYDNAETEDLWRALQKTSKKPVEKIMKNWTSNPGYPLLTLSKKKDKLMISQERFYSSISKKNRKGEKWLVPLSIISDDTKKEISLLVDHEAKTIDGFSKSSWIKVNSNDTSFVRVKYPLELAVTLEKPIRELDQKLGEVGRFALVRDAFALVEGGYGRSDEALRLLSYYNDENSYIIWAEIVTHLLEYKNLLSNQNTSKMFDNFSLKLLSGIAERVGSAKSKGETHEQTLLRSTVLFAFGAFGDKKTIDFAKKLFVAAMAGRKIDSDLKSASYALVALYGGKVEFEKLLDIYLKIGSEEEKDRALRAMCSFSDRKFLKRVLMIGFSKDVRAQDAFKVVYLMSGNPKAIDLVWEYLKEHWEEVVERFAGGHLFSRFISPFSKFTSYEKADEVEQFFKEHKQEGVERTLAQTLEKIRSNAALLERDGKLIENLLKG